MKISTGLRSKLMDTGALRTIMNLGFIKIYSGAVPDSPDSPPTGVLLNTVSNNSTGTGLTFDAAAAGGVISKAAAEVWSGNNVATGTATYFRHVAPGDDGSLSTTQVRIQGTISTVGGDMNLSSVALVNGAPQTVDYYSVTIPPY